MVEKSKDHRAETHTASAEMTRHLTAAGRNELAKSQRAGAVDEAPPAGESRQTAPRPEGPSSIEERFSTAKGSAEQSSDLVQRELSGAKSAEEALRERGALREERARAPYQAASQDQQVHNVDGSTGFDPNALSASERDERASSGAAQRAQQWVKEHSTADQHTHLVAGRPAADNFKHSAGVADKVKQEAQSAQRSASSTLDAVRAQDEVDKSEGSGIFTRGLHAAETLASAALGRPVGGMDASQHMQEQQGEIDKSASATQADMSHNPKTDQLMVKRKEYVTREKFGPNRDIGKPTVPAVDPETGLEKPASFVGTKQEFDEMKRKEQQQQQQQPKQEKKEEKQEEKQEEEESSSGGGIFSKIKGAVAHAVEAVTGGDSSNKQ